jgi:hypothetical protein
MATANRLQRRPQQEEEKVGAHFEGIFPGQTYRGPYSEPFGYVIAGVVACTNVRFCVLNFC